MASRPSRFLSALTIGAALVFGQVTAAFAGPASDTVKAKEDSLRDLLRNPSAENQKKISAIFDTVLNYQQIAQDSLGKEWAARSDSEKAEFSDLLKQLVRRSWERNLKKTLNYDVDFVGEDTKGNLVIVKTKAKPKGESRDDPFEVNYTLADDGGWKVRDITTEGVSLVGSYRSQFTKVIKKDGFPALIQKMKDKIAKGDV